jgi:uncharacterized membrane protein
MNIEKKLARWREAGLLDEAAAARIAAFEQKSQRPVMLYALGGLGALTLGIGIVSIVAANWEAIPRQTKLGIDLAFGAALAAALYVAASRGQKWLSDVLAGVYYAFVLASIALLGQLYQLGSPQYQGLLMWSLATAPFMLLVRGTLLGAVWLLGLLTTHAFCYVELFTSLEDAWSDEAVVNLAVSLTFATQAGYMVLARLPAFAAPRPHVSAVWTRLLWTTLVLGALTLCIAFYSDIEEDKLGWAVAVCGAVTGGLYLLLPRLYPDVSPRARSGMGMLLAATWLLLATATTTDRYAMPAVGALAQVGVLAISAWTVLALGSVRTFNLLTALIALRVLIMYFEVFGSMLDTGLGMITGGLLTLLLAWIWKNKSSDLAERLGAEGGTSRAS